MTPPDSRVFANPSKSFFIDMITRDLTMTDAILDLIDNSIDQAVKRQRVDVMKSLITHNGHSRFKTADVSVRFSKSEFSIRDTCGGISVSDARKCLQIREPSCW